MSMCLSAIPFSTTGNATTRHFFDFDKDLGNGFIARMRQGDWAPFALPLTVPPDSISGQAQGVVGSWVKLLVFMPDLSTFNIYLGNVVHNVGYPQTFIEQIDKTVGFWPAEPDFFNWKERSSTKQLI